LLIPFLEQGSVTLKQTYVAAAEFGEAAETRYVRRRKAKRI
jgi:hypothetical protein